MVRCRVMLLDGKDFTCEIDKQSKGQDLFDKVCQHIGLQEKDYFSCSYRDGKNFRFWLKNDKKINRQIGNSVWLFSFEVKFYPCDPSTLKEEFTRYQLFLQIRRDIVSSKLPCSFMSLAVLGSYVIQSQCGDYEPTEHGAGTRYISQMSLAPQQTDELLDKIAELHKTHSGLTPAEAEFYYLENASKLALYGVDLHLAKDNTGADIEIGVCALGLLLYKSHLRVNRFSWAKILSFSYKWNVFSVKIRPGENESGPTNLEYKLTTDKLAKRLWRIAVEHHTFFRLREPGMPNHGLMAHFSPKYRYSGRTLYQAQLASSTSVSGTLDRSTTSSLMSGRRRAGGASKSLESVLAGYSTERSEMYTPDSKRTATIDLKNRSARLNASTPTSETRSFQMAENGRNLLDNSSYCNEYVKNPPGASSTMNRNAAVSPYSTMMGTYNSQSVPYSQDADGQFSEGYGTGGHYWPGPGNRDHSESPMMCGPDGKPLPPYQDDRLTERGYGRHGPGTWDPYVSGTSVQSSMRTYNAPGGSIYAEYRTVRNNGNWENQYEGVDSEDIDHDKALTEAILAVTAMSTDLSVEKIEIIHNSTVTN